MLWMEPSGACNLDCPDCPTAAGRGGGVMKLGDFTAVLDQAPHLKLLNLWHRGEPLLAPDLPEMIAEAARRGIRTQTYTNGILLASGDLADRLVEARLSRITIGVDGADEDTYRRFRRGGSLGEVEAGVRALVAARRARRTKTPRIVVECLLSNQPPSQFAAVRETAFGWGCDEVRFKTFRVSDPEDLDRSLSSLPENRKLWRYRLDDGRLVMKRYRRSCLRLSYSAVVTWNGDVLPCCFDATGRFTAGNVSRTPLREIWRGGLLGEFRARINHGARDRISMCRNCTEGLLRLYIPHRTVLR